MDKICQELYELIIKMHKDYNMDSCDLTVKVIDSGKAEISIKGTVNY